MATTCDQKLAANVIGMCKSSTEHSTAIDVRFENTFTIWNYGRPKSNMHAYQMELAQSAYLSGGTGTPQYDIGKAERLRAVLRDVLEYLTRWRPNRAH